MFLCISFYIKNKRQTAMLSLYCLPKKTGLVANPTAVLYPLVKQVVLALKFNKKAVVKN